ncbi:helix-turn-helix domain-containing protein [Tsukamurella conjunctivitidis]|nr:helix-turn-helix domain-containing protein [Tsukamurella conjunctivitidis]
MLTRIVAAAEQGACMDRYLTTREVCALTGYHEKTIHNAARQYKSTRGRKGLKSCRQGRHGDYRYLESDVHAWMQGR